MPTSLYGFTQRSARLSWETTRMVLTKYQQFPEPLRPRSSATHCPQQRVRPAPRRRRDPRRRPKYPLGRRGHSELAGSAQAPWERGGATYAAGLWRRPTSAAPASQDRGRFAAPAGGKKRGSRASQPELATEPAPAALPPAPLLRGPASPPTFPQQ